MLAKNYSPQEVELSWYQFWEKSGFFTPETDSRKKPFCIIMPPPNANGSLHIGHALFVTLQDILTRYHRMLGDAALWLPGADHAGILTQVVFERLLEKEGKTRFDLGRTEFNRQCFDFTKKNKEVMYSQLKALGASCDWTREKFTLDPKLVRVALETFVLLYTDPQKLAYRGERLINWCPRCQTALSDLEVEYIEKAAKLWTINYPLKNPAGKDQFITVATTRPETLLGDTAVAVNPSDKRYKDLVGQTVLIPLINLEIPIIADEAVDSEFGTGAVKVTPAHDPTDLEISQRQGVFDKNAVVIGFDDTMMGSRVPDDLKGLNKYKARKVILARLYEHNFIDDIEGLSYKHRVSQCERCKEAIETLVSLQWFIKMTPLAKPAKEVVKNGEIKIIPSRFEKVYFQWLDNIRDWCVSRQLWWGPQLPVWYCGVEGLSDLQKALNPDLPKDKHGCGSEFVTIEPPLVSCPSCGKKDVWIQDPDTFDTWFTSGQWPYTTLGFEQGTNSEHLKDFEYFYPTNVMETGYEILFFWVARMVMLGLYRTKEIPFKTVYLHGLVRDAFGQKMSKSKGNVINPLEVLEKYGADSLRIALIAGISSGRDSSLSEDKIRGYRNFTNKIYNISRFILANLGDDVLASPNENNFTEADQKILADNDLVIKKVKESLEKFRFSDAALTLYEFIWHNFADVYLEKAKDQLKDGNLRANTQYVLCSVFETQLRLLHPFMPFVTEEIWQKLPNKKGPSIMVADWPRD